MRRPKLLDLFCGAGGAGMGYHRAGFDVTGVDIKPQKRYPFTFVQTDALEYLRDHWQEYAVIHTSPPCQAHTALKSMPNAKVHEDLIEPTRALLVTTGKPYVIENVPGAPLRACFILCGTMFGLRTDCGAELRRHRLFETNWFAGMVPPCAHYSDTRRTVQVYGHTGGSSTRELARRATVGVYCGGDCTDSLPRPATITVAGDGGGMSKRRESKAGLDARMFCLADRRTAMGIDWMSGEELSQSIPPAYTEWIGAHLIEAIR